MSTQSHILSRDDAVALRKEWLGNGEKVVFTNGCFDILHRGHVRYLEQAAALGDRLIVGLNSDDSTRRLKGPARPVNKQEDRAVVLAALRCIDAVVIFQEDTPLELIKALRPDLLVKGGDYTEERVVGAREVQAWDGKVEILPFLEGYSTSGIIDQINTEDLR